MPHLHCHTHFWLTNVSVPTALDVFTPLVVARRSSLHYPGTARARKGSDEDVMAAWCSYLNIPSSKQSLERRLKKRRKGKNEDMVLGGVCTHIPLVSGSRCGLVSWMSSWASCLVWEPVHDKRHFLAFGAVQRETETVL